ncbi:MAG TPA: 8-amino-7-oxononanoate synthase [Gammaproteobacteria bacterium]|nr:8-amino-7-oxononanoate synthase [Gammaproteobacteria bacterium]
MKDLAAQLDDRKARHLYRRRRVVAGPQGPEATVDGRRCLTFCSNDYLGLANDSQVVQAFRDAVTEYGVGSGAAHLVTGHSAAHHALEEELAAFVGRPRALLFSTGYMANLGVAGALLDHHDRLFEDRYNHASLLDAARYSGARLVRYGHGDSGDLERRLGAAGGAGALVSSDGVFSMDGDLAPVRALAELARRHGATLMIDDAHGLGVLGEHGGGLLEQQSLGVEDVPILVGTLGKAFGTFGAFVAGSEALIETLIQQARTYVYTTAPPPAVAQATRASLRLVQQDGWRRERLRSLVARFREGASQLGLALTASTTPIQPLRVGDAARALALSDALLEQGVLISAIRPPTVPAGTARLRITLSAAHQESHVDRLLDALDGAGANRLAG